MKDLRPYLKYYWLEKQYLLKEIAVNFKERGHLTAEEFFAIVIWKSNRSKTKVLKGVKKTGKTVQQITEEINKEKDRAKKVEILDKIDGIGIPIASAILTVCYPGDFTIVDYRIKRTIKKMGLSFKGDPSASVPAYLKYLDICRTKITKEQGLSLRDTDRALWGFDFYEGKNGLKDLVRKLR